jgi:GTP pyrophosphokinase
VLRNGDEVLILTSKTQTPPSAWERIAVTGRARSAIRRATRDAVRKQYVELGRRLLAARFEKVGLAYTDESIRKALPRLSHKSVDDVLAAVGRSELGITDLMKAVAPEHADKLVPAAEAKRPRNRHQLNQGQEGWFALGNMMGLKFRLPAAADHTVRGVIPIRGARNDIPVAIEEGGAVPGDRIVGVLTPGQGVRIFQIHSPRLKDYEQESWIDVTWDIDPDRPERFPAKLSVTAVNEPGSLAQIAQVIGEADGNIDNLRMVRRASDFTEMLIEVEVWDLEHLNRIIAGLRSKAVVSKVERVFV